MKPLKRLLAFALFLSTLVAAPQAQSPDTAAELKAQRSEVSRLMGDYLEQRFPADDRDGSALLARARELSTRTLQAAEARFGPRHVETARSLLAHAMAHVDQPKEAAALIQRAFRIAQVVFAPRDPEILNYFMMRALTMAAEPAAEQAWLEMLAQAESVYGQRGRETARYRELLIGFYAMNGRLSEVERLRDDQAKLDPPRLPRE